MILFAVLAIVALDPTQANGSDVAAQPAPVAVTAPVVTEDGFRFGIDTLANVTAKLGKPNNKQLAADGTTTIAYISVHTRIKGASFIPVVGLFAGGAKARTASKTFVFGADGFLKSYSSGDSQVNCGASPFGAGCH